MSADFELIYKEEAYAILGACFGVYNEMGSGFAEAIYQECLELEFASRRVPAMAQTDLRIRYKGQELMKRYQPDFVCYRKIIVELKAVTALTPAHQSQLLNYLKATDFTLGLLVKFGNPTSLEGQRIGEMKKPSRRNPTEPFVKIRVIRG
jgi:GxxExxY protein